MTALIDRACEAIARAQDEMLDTLEHWVRINSFTGNIDGVNTMGAALEEAFRGLGLEFERKDAAADGVGDHLVWRSAAWSKRPAAERVLLIGHHDTVFPTGTFEGFERQGDRAVGPGVLDMKGGLLVVRAALKALSESGALDELPLAVVSVADEETGSVSSRPMLEELARGARAALVFESGRADDSIVTCRKGTGGLKVKARGRAAHAGNSHAEGVNAIWALSRLIDRLQRMTDYDRGITVNVGVVSGGEAKNTVPARAECGVDFRFLRAVDGLDLVAAVDRAARDIAAESGTSMSIEGGVRRAPLERTEASVALYRAYAACAERFGLGGGEAKIQGGGSDANTVSAIGVPAIDGLGPRGRGFHTHDEYIEVPTLVPRARALCAILLELQSGASGTAASGSMS